MNSIRLGLEANYCRGKELSLFCWCCRKYCGVSAFIDAEGTAVASLNERNVNLDKSCS